MLRLTGCILIFVGACRMGWSAAREKKRKVENLRELVLAFRMMEREIGIRMTPLPELMRMVSLTTKETVSCFFAACSLWAENNDGLFGEKWEKEIRKLGAEIGEKSAEHLLRLGWEIGRYNWEEEEHLLSLTAQELEGSLRIAELESTRCGRLYRTLGAAAGAALVILFI